MRVFLSAAVAFSVLLNERDPQVPLFGFFIYAACKDPALVFVTALTLFKNDVFKALLVLFLPFFLLPLSLKSLLPQ
jgi:hypothetical protein